MIEVVKGGLILDLGVRGFLPASLVDIRRVQDLDEFLGQELRCKVIELNRSRNNVVLSRRAVLEDERKEMRQAILDRLSPGDVVEGQISNIVDFGAFVDLDGMDGLIHISELSWSHVNHPSEVLEIGQDVQVKVLDIDRDRQRISLGLKQTQSDPWQQVVDAYNENDVVQGKVTKVVTFGAFVEIMPGVEGLVHISELAQHHVENPREVVSQGDVVNVKIIEVDADRRRLSLSLKRVEEGDDVQPRADGQPLETPAAAADRPLGRGLRGRAAGCRTEEPSDSLLQGEEEPAGAEAPSEEPEPEEPVAEVAPEVPAEEPVAEVAPEADEPEEPVAEVDSGGRRAEEPAADDAEARTSRRTRSTRTAGPGRFRGRAPRTPPTRLSRTELAGRSRSRSPAASERARARRWPRSRAHGAATISSDEVVHELYDDPEVQAALVERFGTSDRREQSAKQVVGDRDALLWLEGLLHPRVIARTEAWRDELAQPAGSAGAGGQRGAAPLRGRRRGPLRRRRRDHRAARAPRRARRRARSTSASSACSRTRRRSTAPTSPTSTTARSRSSTRSWPTSFVR